MLYALLPVHSHAKQSKRRMAQISALLVRQKDSSPFTPSQGGSDSTNMPVGSLSGQGQGQALLSYIHSFFLSASISCNPAITHWRGANGGARG